MPQDLTTLKQHPAVFRMYADRLHLSKDGKEWVAKCIFHAGDNTPSLRIFYHENTLIYKCFGCDSKGSILDFISNADKISITQAIKKVEEYIGHTWEDSKSKVDSSFKPYADEKKELRVFTLSEYAKLEQALEQNTFVQNWLLQERGIGMDVARRLHLGYRQTIQAKSKEIQDVLDKGWVAFPRIEGDKVIGIHYRSIVRKAFSRQPNMATALFNTETIDLLEPLYVTEGEADTCVLEQVGLHAVSIPNATTEITPSMKDQIMQADCVILAGDCDGAAGSKKMEKLWTELQERSFLLHWPEGCKDANETFLKHCGRDVEKFRALVLELTNLAKSKPMQGVYSIQHSLMSAEHARLIDHPNRLRFPWKSVDDMAIILPGDVITAYSTDSGMGKTTWVLQASIYAAKEHNEIVLNYQAEMSPNQIDTIFTSHLLKKDRLQILDEDYKAAAQVLGNNFKYYIGRDTSLTTIGEVLDLIEMAVKRFGATLVILDNLHFLCRNEQDQIKAQANAMQRIKNMAGKYGLKFLVVHQARKADQNHKRKVTHISDMDGSKSVQNDSSVAFSIHRDEIKHSKDEQVTGEHEYDPVTEIRLQKVREKGPGKSFARLMFVGNICTFTELAQVAPFREEEPAEEQEMVF